MASNQYRLESDQAANRGTLWRFSIAAIYAISSQYKLAFDSGVLCNQDVVSMITPAYLLTGLIYTPNKNIDLDLGAKFGLSMTVVERQSRPDVAPAPCLFSSI